MVEKGQMVDQKSKYFSASCLRPNQVEPNDHTSGHVKSKYTHAIGVTSPTDCNSVYENGKNEILVSFGLGTAILGLLYLAETKRPT